MECAAAAAGRLEQAADKLQARLDAGFLAEFDGSWCFSLEELDRRAGQAKGRLRAVLARVDKEVDDWVVQADCFMNLMLAAAEAGSTAWVPVSFPPAPLVGPVVMRWREGVAAHVVGNTAIVAPAPWDADLHLKRIEGWRGCSLVHAHFKVSLAHFLHRQHLQSSLKPSQFQKSAPRRSEYSVQSLVAVQQSV